jgi:hypothetical protein
MNPKMECVVCAITNLDSSGEISVGVCDAKSLGGENRSSLKFSHMTLSAETYRSWGLMVGGVSSLLDFISCKTLDFWT